MSAPGFATPAACRLSDDRSGLGAEIGSISLYPRREPRLHFLFDPCDGMRCDFDAHGEIPLALQLVDLGFA